MARQFLKLSLLLITACILISCTEANRAFKKNNQAVSATQHKIKRDEKHFGAVKPPVVIKNNYYVDTTPIAIDGTPYWLKNSISFNGKNLPFSFMVSRLLRNTDAIVTYRDGIDSNKSISMNYKGNIKGALDNLALKSDYAYTITNQQIVWSDIVTKTFDISFMPGTAEYAVGQTGETGGSTGGSESTTTSGELYDQQYNTLKGNLSVWNDLRSTLQELKSKEGTVNISEATTTVTVHDHPANVRAINKYLKRLNKELSKQVELKVQVLQVELNNTYQYGIDWNVIKEALGTEFSLKGNIIENIPVRGTSQIVNPPVLQIGEETSNAIIQAIGQQGKIAVVTEPTVITLNNQVAELRITTDTSYVKRAEQTMSTEGSTSSSLEPGVVTDGFMLYLLPKIQDNKVYLQVSSTISSLRGIDTINNFGGKNTPVEPKTNDNGNTPSVTTIQIPTISEKRFIMRSALNNGSTLIIAGFKELRNETNKMQVFGSSIIGGRASDRRKLETIILITPIVIENSS